MAARFVISMRSKHGDLRAPEQFSEAGVECDKVFAELNHRRREPRVGDIVGGQILFHSELAQHGPLGTERRHLNARHRKERIQKFHGIFHGRRADEYFRIRCEP
jgi:hypothetical protein